MSTEKQKRNPTISTCLLLVVMLWACRGGGPSGTEIMLDVVPTAAIGPPTLVSPANGRGIGVPLIVRLRWKPVPGANLYAVELAKDTSFRWIFFSTKTESLSIQTSQLEPRRYYWHVKALISDRETEWSGTWWFLQSSTP